MIHRVNESSLSRLNKMSRKYDCGQISAFRDYNTRAVNMEKHKQLGKKLRDLDLGLTQIIGGYQYGGEGDVSKEMSWFVWDKNDTGELKKILTKLGTEFDQESILFTPAGEKGHLIYTRDDQKQSREKIGNRSRNSRSRTWGRRNPNSRAFSQLGSRPFADDIEYEFPIKKVNESEVIKDRFVNAILEAIFENR